MPTETMEFIAGLKAFLDGVTKKDGPHSFSSTQFDLPDEIAERVKSLAAAIPNDELAEDGREETPHVTVKYGLHGDDAEQVRRVVSGFAPVRIRLGETSLFPAKEASAQRGGSQYDVVKIDVDSPDLHRLNKAIAQLPHTDTHPIYKPHVTLAYVVPGAGKRHIGPSELTGTETTLSELVFSDREGNKTVIPLNGSKTPLATKAHHLASLLPSLPPDLAAHARSHAEQHFATLAASHGQERALSILSAGLESVPLPADVTKAAPLLGAAELYVRMRDEGKRLAPVTLWLASDDADAAALAGHFADVPLGRIYCGLGRKAQALASVVARERAAVVPTGALSPDRVLSFLQAAIEEANDSSTLIIAPSEVLGVASAWLEAGQPEIGLPLPRAGRVSKGAVLHVEGRGQAWQVKAQAVLKCMEGENAGKPGPCPQGGKESTAAPKKRPMQVFDDTLDEAAVAISDDPKSNVRIVEAVYEQADKTIEAISAQVDDLIDYMRTSNEEGRDADLLNRIQGSLKDYENEIRSGKAEIIEKLEAVRDAFDDWATSYHYRDEDEDLEAERADALATAREELQEALEGFPAFAQNALSDLQRGINAAVEEQDSEWQSAADGYADSLNSDTYAEDPEGAASDAEIYNDELKEAGNPYRLMQDEDGVWYVDVPDEEEAEGKKRLAERRTKAMQKRHDRWLTKNFSVTKTLDRQGGELPIVDRTSLERADFITYPEDVQGSNCSNCIHNPEGVCQFHGEVAGQEVDLRGQPVNERNCCSGWDARGTLRAWRDRAKTARPVRKSQPADASGDADSDPVATAEAIADVLGGLLGEGALAAFETTEAEEQGKPAKAFAGILKAWDALAHPRGANGRFIPKGSAEAVASARAGIDEIRKLGEGARTPEHAKKLADHLSILTVKQLHELRREYGLKASGKLREHLVAKLLDRLPGAQERIDKERQAAAKQLGLPAEATMRDIVEHVAVEAGYPEHFISKQELEEKLDELGVSVPVQRGEAVRAAFEVLREGVREKEKPQEKPESESPESTKNPTVGKEPWQLTRAELAANFERGGRSGSKTPWSGRTPEPGELRIDPDLGAVERAERININDVVLREPLRMFDPREADVERYTQWLREGHTPPPLDAVVGRDGKIIVLNSRRVEAARRAGVETLMAWVQQTDADGRALTYRNAVESAIEEGKPVPSNVIESIGFTGTDSLGRRWEDGKLVAKPQEEKPAEQPAAESPLVTAAQLRERAGGKLDLAAIGRLNNDIEKLDRERQELTAAGIPDRQGLQDKIDALKNERDRLAGVREGESVSEYEMQGLTAPEKNPGKKPQSPIDNTPKGSDNTSGGGEKPKPEEPKMTTQELPKLQGTPSQVKRGEQERAALLKDLEREEQRARGFAERGSESAQADAKATLEAIEKIRAALYSDRATDAKLFALSPPNIRALLAAALGQYGQRNAGLELQLAKLLGNVEQWQAAHKR